MESMDNRKPAPATRAPCPRGPCPLPLRLELDAVHRILETLRIEGKTCLDVGFTHPLACRRLRHGGGYWTSVAHNDETRARLSDELNEDVALSPGLEALPFEDKQFDVVVLALGCLSGGGDADTALVRECHRLLKVPGYLILTVEFAKPFGLASLLTGTRGIGGVGGQYSEAALFDLLKTGFDWLGMRHFCRFWAQLVRLWATRRHADDAGANAVLYWAARQFDVLSFLSRGYLMTVCGRRKGWRPRQTPYLSDGRSISEAVLH